MDGQTVQTVSNLDTHTHYLFTNTFAFVPICTPAITTPTIDNNRRYCALKYNSFSLFVDWYS
jgi:hypothetical protein